MPGLAEDKILLIHPAGMAGSRDIGRVASLMPPLGLLSLAAYLDAHGQKTAVIDGYAERDPDRRIRAFLETERPAFLGVSCTTPTFRNSVRLAGIAKELLPELRTVFGGPHVSALRERILRDFPAVDFVVAGEGEETLLALMQGGANAPASVPGLIYRTSEGQVRSSGVREPIADLDTLPFPAYGKLAGYPQRYMLPIFTYPTTPNASCVTSRGCPYGCSYCDRSVFGPRFRFNSAAYMYEHLRHLRRTFAIRHVNFYDDLFTLNRERIEEFCRLLLERPLGITFNCAVRADRVDPELLRLMRRAGCWMISVGIETGDPALLDRHRTNPDLELLAVRIRQIKDAGIRTKGLLMLGLPGESETSIRKSMDYVFRLPLDTLNIAKFTPFPGSPLYAHIRDHGEFDEEWDRMDCLHFQFVPTGLTRERLEALFRAFYKAHYLRPRVLWDQTSMIWRSPDSWRRFVHNAGRFLAFAFRGSHG